MNFFTHWFIKAQTKPMPIEKPQYEKPKIHCSSLILLSGPAYGDKTFFGSFVLNAVSVRDWALDHSANVISSAYLEQQARVFLPVWLDRVSNESNNYITLIDMPMRQVLVPYTYDFYLKGWLSFYCYQCCKFHDTLVDNIHNHQKVGHTSNWTEEWLCPAGHILHQKEQEMRLIVKKLRN
jgi:hypothetical protein